MLARIILGSGLALCMAAPPMEALAAGPGKAKRVEVKKPDETRKRKRKRDAGPPPLGELSSGGTDRGTFELILGSVTVGVAATLGVVGAFALGTGIRRREECDFDYTSYCDVVSPNLDFAAAGLSWGVMVPLTVAGGLLIAKGRRIRNDHRLFHAQPTGLSLRASRNARGTSIALGFGLRF